MGTPFMGEIKIISWNFAPKGWAFCNGQLLPINQNQALFAILGTTYGGDGRVNFGLPNLQGRIPIHFGDGFVLGERAGELSHTIVNSEMPQHTHVPLAGTNADQSSPVGNFWGSGAQQVYASSSSNNTAMSPTAVSNIGGSQAHENMPPYLVLNFIIALVGVFPVQN